MTFSPVDMTSSPAAKATIHDRAVGTLVGSALGDAVGLYTEFLPKGRIGDLYPTGTFSLLPNATPFARDMHRLKHVPGEWTDDTDHALLIVLSYLHNSALDPRDVASRLHTWVLMGLRALDTPPLGLGATVGAIVRSGTYLDDPIKAAHAHWVKSGHKAAANGSLMRTHPLGVLCLHRTQEETFEVAARFSAITHVDPRCVVSCMVGTALVRALIRGDVRDEAGVNALVDAAIEDYAGRIVPLFRAEGPFTADDPGLDVEEVCASMGPLTPVQTLRRRHDARRARARSARDRLRPQGTRRRPLPPPPGIPPNLLVTNTTQGLHGGL